jgi:DNA modification methylase
MDIDSMRLPYSEVSLKRMEKPIKKRFARTEDNQDKNEYKDWSPNPLGALPSTILTIGSESKRQSQIHTAVYPEKLVEYFIKGFTKPGQLVCDIFSGSGTSACVAKKLGRNYLGFELSEEYVTESESRIANSI